MKLIINTLKNLINDEESANSLRKIVGSSQEIMVYGLASCYWDEVWNDCKRQKYSVYYYDNYPYDCIRYSGDEPARKCKAILTSLILENAKRLAEGKPIIPLIFVVETNEKKISLTKVASTHGGEEGNVTDQEIRRLCKMRACDPEIGRIVDLTVKFVKATPKTSYGCTFYVLEQIQPLWDIPAFEKMLRRRKHRHLTDKQFPWKKILTEQISKISCYSTVPLLFNSKQKTIDGDGLLDSKNTVPGPYLRRFIDKASTKRGMEDVGDCSEVPSVGF